MRVTKKEGEGKGKGGEDLFCLVKIVLNCFKLFWVVLNCFELFVCWFVCLKQITLSTPPQGSPKRLKNNNKNNNKKIPHTI